MTLRFIPDTLDPEVVATVDARLQSVATEHDVRVAWAIESGSRAWGFPSPDSDYDCRFLYVRPTRDYLTPWPHRDVIETPLDAVYDVNGWDLVKALRLLVRSNATAVEWLQSPIVYSGDASFRDLLLGAVPRLVDRVGIGRHYTHLADTQWSRHGAGTTMPLKRLLYAVRPAVAVAWLLDHHQSAVPPMDLPTLLEGTTLTSAERDELSTLLEAKARTRELGEGPVPPALRSYVETQLRRGHAEFDQQTPIDPVERRRTADEVFRQILAADAGTSVPS